MTHLNGRSYQHLPQPSNLHLQEQLPPHFQIPLVVKQLQLQPKKLQQELEQRELDVKCVELPVHVQIVETERVEIVRQKRSNIYVIFLVVIRFMEKHLIFELIFVGTLVKGLLYATGYFVVKGLLVLMNYRDTEEHIQVTFVSFILFSSSSQRNIKMFFSLITTINIILMCVCVYLSSPPVNF